MRKILCYTLTPILLLLHAILYAQDSIVSSPSFPTKYLTEISSKAAVIKQKLDKNSQRSLEKLQTLEGRLKKKLARVDTTAISVFGNIDERYDNLKKKLASKSRLTQYIPYLDSLNTSLDYLEKNKQLLKPLTNGEAKLQAAVGSVKELETSLQQAEDIKRFLKERTKLLKEQLAKSGFGNQLKKINKLSYYYSGKVNEYKGMICDYRKAEQQAIKWLSSTKPFRDFMQKNSQLASLFRMPGASAASPASSSSLGQFQTRAAVNNAIQTRVAGGVSSQNLIDRNMQSSSSQFSLLKEKMQQYKQGSFGNTDSDPETPDFKPNSQKVKRFLKRLEYGANLQSQKASNFFPVTTDVGLSLGYRLNDNSVIGIGASYKIGLGKSWQHIKFSNEGIGARSFVDYTLKGTIFISGGYEQNYRTAFNSIDQLKNLNKWQTSGLIGLGKKYQVSKKLKGNIQLLWDFLSYRQKPQTQAVLFRIGYSWH